MALQAALNIPANYGFGKKSELFDDMDNFLANTCGNFTSHSTLALPPMMNFSTAESALSHDECGKKVKIHFNKGTTCLGFRYKNGVILAADSRATGGQFVASNEVEKVIPINKFLLGTMAGGAADCTYWERILSERCRIYELRNRERISVAAASKILSNIMYNYKGMGLSLGVMISGWDKRGPGLYYVDNDGNRLTGDVFSVGSGSPYAYGAMDSGYSFDLEDQEAFELGRRAIYHATHRDAFSGGIVRVFHIGKDGWTRVSEEDCKELHYKYQDEKMI